MNCKTILLRGVVAVTVGSIFAPQIEALAASPVSAASTDVRSVRDVALADGGQLRGQLVDSAGSPLAGVPVSLLRNGREVAATTTGANGAFAINGLRGGTYELVAAQAHQVYRLWTPDNAPPSALDNALVVGDGNVTRGQAPSTGLSWPTVGAIGAVGLMAGGVYAIFQSDSGS